MAGKVTVQAKIGALNAAPQNGKAAQFEPPKFTPNASFVNTLVPLASNKFTNEELEGKTNAELIIDFAKGAKSGEAASGHLKIEGDLLVSYGVPIAKRTGAKTVDIECGMFVWREGTMYAGKPITKLNRHRGLIDVVLKGEGITASRVHWNDLDKVVDATRAQNKAIATPAREQVKVQSILG